jgi:hypothetical protein
LGRYAVELTTCRHPRVALVELAGAAAVEIEPMSRHLARAAMFDAVTALCIASGQCTGTPAEVISKLRSDAAAQELPYGFEGDPNHHPAIDRAYGYLLRARAY